MFAMTLVLASCNKEQITGPQGGEGLVTFTAELPGAIATKAYSDGQTAKKLSYYVYDEDNASTNIAALNGTATFNDELTTTVTLNLVAGKRYSIVFWADAFGQGADAPADRPYKYDAQTKLLSVTYGTEAQDESRDAFYVYEPMFKVTGPINKTITLKRPFAQINVGTSDYEVAKAAGLTVTQSKMTVVGVATSINLSDGTVTGNETAEFTTAAIPSGERFPVDIPGTDPAKPYDYLGMNYVLVGADKTTVDVTLTCDEPSSPMTFTQIPVQRNYRTNIFGALLTDPATFNVEIDNNYGVNDGNHFDHDADEGKTTISATVDSFEEAQAALNEGATTLVITTAPTEAATLNIPKIFETGNTETLSIVLPETDQDITLVYGEQTESAPKNIDVKANSTGKLSIIAPESTVSVSGSFGELEVETADDTLIVGEDAEVTSLKVKKGNVEIYGKVGSITFVEGAGVVKVWVVRDTESLVTALEVAGNEKCEKLIVSGITLTENVDLGNTEVWFEGNINLGGNTVSLGNENWIKVEKDLTITNGTIDNTASGDPATGHQKSLIHVMGGEFVLDGVTLINDMDYHWHGSVSERPYNSSAVSYWNDAKIVIRKSRILSGEFTLCGMGRGGANTADVYLVDSYFESSSTNKNNGRNWAYAMRVFGKKIVMENCKVKGIQGAVSIEECVDAEIRSGKYYTVNSAAGVKDAFYPLYVTGGATVKISGGEFSGANKWTGLEIGGTSAISCGDNDTGMELGSVILTGGKFSGKAYNHETNVVYEPLKGYVYKAIENGEIIGEQPLVWEIVPEE